MLEITNEAMSTLKDSLEGTGQDGHVFRLERSGDDLAIGLGGAEEGDTVFDFDGNAILAVPTDLVQELDATIDVEETNEGPKLVLT